MPAEDGREPRPSLVLLRHVGHAQEVQAGLAPVPRGVHGAQEQQRPEGRHGRDLEAHADVPWPSPIGSLDCRCEDMILVQGSNLHTPKYTHLRAKDSTRLSTVETLTDLMALFQVTYQLTWRSLVLRPSGLATT